MGQLAIRVQPGARSTGFAGWYGDLPKLAVVAPPVDGAANDAVVAAIAAAFAVRRRQVHLISGMTSRTKRVEVDGISDGELSARVAELNPR
jgi:uncharacterized protein (TIGR00251 family)